MKTRYGFILVPAAIILGFLAARWCAAQPARQPSSRAPATDEYIALHQFESFVTYLQETKQTNILKRLTDYSNASIAAQNAANLGITLAILERLREGRTNDAFELLEGRVSSDITGFVASYRELPASLREKMSLKLIAHARDYRAKFPFKHRYPSVDDGVMEAFKILEEQPAK